MKAGSFVFPLGLRSRYLGWALQGSSSVVTELGKADGFMTHCFNDIFTKSCLQDSGSLKRRDLLEMEPAGKIIGGRLLMRKVSAEVHV